MAEPLELHFEPFEGRKLGVQLYSDVKNGAQLRERIAAGTLPDGAFINADMVPSLFHLHLSAYKALCDQADGKQTTRSLHADIVFNLAGSKHIAGALSAFGVSADTRTLLVARVDATPEDWDAISAVVRGTPVAWDESCLGSAPLLRKAFKVSDQELGVGSIGDAALCKGALSQS